jgi:hypothetical protein
LEWLSRHEVLRLGGICLLLLLGPGLAGLALDALAGTFPFLGLAGLLAGTVLANIAIVRIILSRLERLAPRGDTQEGEED